MRNCILILVVTFELVTYQLIFSSDKSNSNFNNYKFGFYGAYNYNIHLSNFHQLPEVGNCCPTFNDGKGDGFTLGLIYELPFQNNVSINGRLLYSRLDANLSSDDNKNVIVDGELTNSVVTHFLETQLSVVNVEALIKFNIIENFSFVCGFNFGYLFNSKFKQDERLKIPTTGNFENNMRSRFEISGAIQNLAVINSNIVAGFSYDLSFDSKNRFYLAPEILFSYGLTPLVPNLDWKAHSIRAGISLKFSPLNFVNEKIEVKPVTEPIIKEISITANSVKSEELYLEIEANPIINKIETNVKEITIEEFLSTRLCPLLNYIFFENNSSYLNQKYIQLNSNMVKQYNLDSSREKSNLDNYYSILNIVGKRMQINKKSKITLIGCNSNEGDEKNFLGLSKNRAQTIYNYLTEVWNIEPYRIKVKAQNLPDKPSNVLTEEGCEENRRVEILSEDSDILSPLILNDTLKIANFEIIRIHLKTNIKKIQYGKVFIKSNDKIIKEIRLENTLPEFIDIIPSDIDINIFKKNSTLNFSVEITIDSNFTLKSSTQSIDVSYIDIKSKTVNKIVTKKFHKFSVILFDYNSYSVNNSDYNMKIIKLIQDQFDNNSKFTIEGFTDRIGDEGYNLELSLKRAKSVADLLKFNNLDYKGIGESKLLFDNISPEGRFYCRTVEITIESKE